MVALVVIRWEIRYKCVCWNKSESKVAVYGVHSRFVRVVAVVLIYFVLLLSAGNVTKQQQCVRVCVLGRNSLRSSNVFLKRFTLNML